MKKIYYNTCGLLSIALLLMIVFVFTACNNEWEDEQYEQMISIKSSPNFQGVTWRNVKYTADGTVTYNIPVIVSGSTNNVADRHVHFELDPDTLAKINVAKFGQREELYFKQLPEQYYSFPEEITIPKGQNVALLPVTYNLSGIDMVEKWVLPIRIASREKYDYKVNPRKYYSCILLEPVPFNEFSGNYSGTQLTGWVGDETKLKLNSEDHRCYVVNDSTVFFYAGLRSVDYTDRALYKIYFRFTGDDYDAKHKYVEIWSDNLDMNFNVNKDAIYSVTKTMDATTPNLQHIYITISNIDYDFVDYTTTPGHPITYHFSGSMTLQRDLDLTTPEEDQNIW